MIDSFSGENRWLSNFWPCQIEFTDLIYPSVEHAYQAAKTFDITIRQDIQKAETAGKAKTLGKNIILREDWKRVRLALMEDFLRQKFTFCELRGKLLQTNEEELIEGNWWGDTYWGVCKGVGENNLGKLLMKIRSEIKNKI